MQKNVSSINPIQQFSQPGREMDDASNQVQRLLINRGWRDTEKKYIYICDIYMQGA